MPYNYTTNPYTQNYLAHHGILGMKWGVRRYQNSDGSLTPKGRARLERKDEKWISKREDKIQTSVKKKVSKDMNNFVKKELNPNVPARNRDGTLSKQYINAYNQRLASLMNDKVGNIEAPSGRVVRFVAKRGEVGVFTALADQNYNMNSLKSGLHSDGRVAYKKEVIGSTSTDPKKRR